MADVASNLSNEELILINPPALLERPPIEQSGTLFIPENLRITAMNPGVLSLASYLNSKNFSVKILDLSLDVNYGSIEDKIKQVGSKFVGISSTSGFDYVEALNIAALVKKYSDSFVILGGQHAGPLGRQVLIDSPHVDAVVKYEGELTLEAILKNGVEVFSSLPGVAFRKGKDIIETLGRPRIVRLDDLPFLDYAAYPDFLRFTPFIEESRGCVYRCNFCSSNTVNGSRIDLKSPRRFLDEAEYCISLFGNERSYCVLASTYGVNPRNGKSIAKGMRAFNVRWSSEFRADSLWEEFIFELLDSGYEVVNVGLESASPDILILMGKTRNPQKYLGKMQGLAKIVKSSDAVIRANFIFYVGETPRTIRETVSFLTHTEGINSVQFSPLLLFPNTPVSRNFDNYRKQFGSERVTGEYWERRHFFPVHPSRYFSFQEIVTLGHVFEQMFSDENAWVEAAKSLYTQETSQAASDVKEILIQARFGR